MHDLIVNIEAQNAIEKSSLRDEVRGADVLVGEGDSRPMGLKNGTGATTAPRRGKKKRK